MFSLTTHQNSEAWSIAQAKAKRVVSQLTERAMKSAAETLSQCNLKGMLHSSGCLSMLTQVAENTAKELVAALVAAYADTLGTHADKGITSKSIANAIDDFYPTFRSKHEIHFKHLGAAGLDILAKLDKKIEDIKSNIPQELEIRLFDAKKEAHVTTTATMQSHVPEAIQNSLQEFRKDYADPSRVGFIMMQFGTTQAHSKIVEAVKCTLKAHGLTGVRADDKQYHDDLFPNILTCLHGCGFGISVFEQIEGEHFNPNVSLEVGYMLALGKPVCFLKDKALATLPADLIAKLYKNFGSQDPFGTIPAELAKWLADKKLAGNSDSIVGALAGKWKAHGKNSSGNIVWEGVFTFFADFTALVEDKNPARKGKWIIERDRIRVNWQDGPWDEFMLPIRPDGISGRSWSGGTTYAAKIQ
jgi:hypothetical protein